MLAIVTSVGSPGQVRFENVAEPEPARDEVLIAVRAVSLNLGTLRRLGWAEDGWRPGYDLAGVVVRAAADGSGPQVGTRAVGLLPEGAWSQIAAVPTRLVAALPDAVDFAVASTVPVAGLTSLAALTHGGTLVGKQVLITGAAGGVGRFAVQLAVMAGAQVTASVGRPERAAGLREIGATSVVVGLASEGPLFDFVLESVGGVLLGAALHRLAPGGTAVSIGGSSDEATKFEILNLVRKGGTSLYGMSLFDELARLGYGRRELSRLLELVASGRIDSQLDLQVSWREVVSALSRLRARSIAGKAVLLVD